MDECFECGTRDISVYLEDYVILFGKAPNQIKIVATNTPIHKCNNCCYECLGEHAEDIIEKTVQKYLNRKKNE